MRRKPPTSRTIPSNSWQRSKPPTNVTIWATARTWAMVMASPALVGLLTTALAGAGGSRFLLPVELIVTIGTGFRPSSLDPFAALWTSFLPQS